MQNYGTIHNQLEGSKSLLALTCMGEPLLSIITDDTLSGQDYLVAHSDGVMRIYVTDGVSPRDISVVADDQTNKFTPDKPVRFDYNKLIERVFVEVGDILSVHLTVDSGNYSVHANVKG
jgi:hypothetical protein